MGASYDSVQFENRGGYQRAGESVTEPVQPEHAIEQAYPKAILPISEKQKQEFLIWLTQWLDSLEMSQAPKLDEWAQQETDYRAKTLGPQSIPFEGASGNVVPAIAMAVDPIHARLDTGIFKSDPVFKLKALRKSFVPIVPGLERFIEYYQRNKLHLRSIVSPRLLECAKHGTMVLKVIYDRDTYPIRTYDDKWNVTKRNITRFSGPRILGVSLNDFFFPPYYQHLQQTPIVWERQRFSYEALKVAEASGKLANCKAVEGQEQFQRTNLEAERARSVNHETTNRTESMLIELAEAWCDYDIDGDGIPEKLVCTIHRPTQTILQLRYNFYFHQLKPYVVIPYTISNDSMYGNGIAEMVKPFQDMLTHFQRHAENNAYLVNIKMFVARKDSGIEKSPKLYAGRTFEVDDPSKDFKELSQTDINDSLVSERQNLFGLSEKRTGVSDYLTGRESPVVGSRATATSTIALIQEGTKRVEQVLENIRNGMAEAMTMCLYIWIQYGLDGLDDLVFGDDQLATDLKNFFDSVGRENIEGAIAIDLAATDAANNKSIQQQMQLAIIQTMMQYLQQVLQLGIQAIQSQQANPELAAWAVEVANKARSMFRDLMTKYDVPNPDEYLPDLEAFLRAAAAGQEQAGGPAGVAGAPGGQPGVPGVPVSPPGTGSNFQPPPSPGGRVVGSIPPTGPGAGLPIGPPGLS